jgi:hypothetical protein
MRLLILLLLASISPASSWNERFLQSSCDRALEIVENATAIVPIANCACNAVGGEGGATANVTCQSCDFCNLDDTVCGITSIKASLVFESDNSVSGESKECFNYTKGGAAKGDLLCIAEDSSSRTCKVSLNGKECTSCEVNDCSDTTQGRKPLADCSNLSGGQKFDLCTVASNITNKNSSFVAFDQSFRENTYGVNKCKSSATSSMLHILCTLPTLLALLRMAF